MANILVLSLVFPPDNVSTAQIMGELAVDLHARGHHITVVTTTPHYNHDTAAAAGQKLVRCWGGLLRRSELHGIRVLHTLMPRKSRRVTARLLAWIWFHLASTCVSIMIMPRPDVLLVPSPPLTIGVSAWIVSRLRRAQFIYNVQELYPDIAVDLGVLRNRPLIRALLRLERFVYGRAAVVTVIASRMRDRLVVKKGVRADKVEIVPNFVDVFALRPGSKDNAFSRRYGVADTFLVTYAGNFGPAQGLETFIDAAALLRDDPGIHCMLIGGGTLEKRLREQIGRLGLSNCSLVPHQPYERVPHIYAASDLCLVPQAAETGCDAIPSKIYRIMACARPVIAVTDIHGDLAQLVAAAGAGAVVPAGSPCALAEVIRRAAQHRAEWQAKGAAGRRHVEQHYSRQHVSCRYHAIVERLTGSSVGACAAGGLI